MNQLILHHGYGNGSAFDLSGKGNHGVPQAVSTTISGTLTFRGGPSRVSVRPSQTLSRLHALRVRVRFMHEPTNLERQNLVEGHMSFAFYITPKAGLAATVYDGRQKWNLLETRVVKIIKPGQWHVAEVQHDGASRMRIVLDGRVQAESTVIPGPVRGVNSYGLAIGHWPNPEDQYSFEGHIDDVRLWRFEPGEHARKFVDRCCVDRKALDDLLNEMRRNGWDRKKTEAWMTEFLEVAAQIKMAMGYQQDDLPIENLARAIRDHRPEQIFAGMASAARRGNRVPKEHVQTLRRLFLSVPLGNDLLRPLLEGRFPDEDQFRKIARIFCLDDLIPGPFAKADAEVPQEKGD